MMIVVCFSGGLDSAVCMMMARDIDPDARAVIFDYGQPQTIETKYAEKFCLKREIEFDSVRLTMPSTGLLADRASPVVAGRNAIFIAHAAAIAAAGGGGSVWFGATREDFDMFPDCGEAFLSSMSRALSAGYKVDVVAPLLKMRKNEIIFRARDFEISENETWSCYYPDWITSERTRRAVACGSCLACKVRSRGFQTMRDIDAATNRATK